MKVYGMTKKIRRQVPIKKTDKTRHDRYGRYVVTVENTRILMWYHDKATGELTSRDASRVFKPEDYVLIRASEPVSTGYKQLEMIAATAQYHALDAVISKLHADYPPINVGSRQYISKLIEEYGV